MSNERRSEDVSPTDPNNYNTIEIKLRQGGIFPRIGRVALAALAGTGVGYLFINEIQASEDNKPCVSVGYTPDTIRDEGVDSTTFEVAVAQACRSGLLRVEADFNWYFSVGGRESQSPTGPVILPLRDDGLGKDRVAGDGKWTSEDIILKKDFLFPYPYEGINGLVAWGPIQTFTLVYSDGSKKDFRAPSSLYILDNKSIPLVSPNNRSDYIQTTPHAINMRDDFLVVGQTLRHINGEQDLRVLTNRLYELAPGNDPYHFLNLTSDKHLYLSNHNSSVTAAGTFKSIRSDVNGTGGYTYPGTDVAQLFGSKGNLRGLVFQTEPVSAGKTFHELAHGGGAYLNTSLGLNYGNEGPARYGHWKNNNSAGGILGGTIWKANPDGSFTSIGYPNEPKLSKLEQYLLGWIKPEQVPPINVALNENQQFHMEGTIINGPFKVVTIQDIIALHGVRTPGPETALRDIKMGYVYTTTGRLATPAEMTARELIAQRLSILWNQATEGQSTMEFVTPKDTPRLLETYDNRTMNSLGTRVKFEPRPEIKAFHVQLIPYNNDGPGINLVIGDQAIIQAGVYQVSQPEIGKGPYIMLPGMSYIWRIRTSEKLQPDVNKEEDWSGWAEDKFKTPPPSAETITPITNSLGQGTDDLTPTLIWNDSDTQMFYYEIQLSEDADFETDPAKAKVPVYWNLVHGGVSKPLNSWTVPDKFPLQSGKSYYWRLRQRVQGDGQPIQWGKTVSFTTPTSPKSVFANYNFGNEVYGPSQIDIDRFSPARAVQHESPLSAVHVVKGEGFISEVLIPGSIPLKEAVFPKQEELL